MEERIRQLEERVRQLEKPTQLNGDLRKLLISDGFIKFEKELWFTSGANLEIVNLFVKVKDNDYVLSALPTGYFHEFTVGVSANTIITKGHGMPPGSQVVFYSTGTLPAPIQNGVSYWVINPTTDTFQASSDGVSPIDITDIGNGVHYWQYFT